MMTFHSSQTADGVERTGIGLVITRLLMAAMGGSLEVSSRYGEGSCFTLGLPAVPSGVAPAS
jgi:signal transduction histidine kinase